MMISMMLTISDNHYAPVAADILSTHLSPPHLPRSSLPRDDIHLPCQSLSPCPMGNNTPSTDDV
jgi:hypothetical protein